MVATVEEFLKGQLSARLEARLFSEDPEKQNAFLRQIGIEPAEKTPDPVEETLSHHGVKGMKWGVRKSGSSGGGGGGSAPSGTTKVASADSKKVDALRTKTAKELSNDQLKEVTTRINMEKKYRELNPSKIDKGHNQIKYLMTFVATGIAIHKALNSEAGKAAMERGRKFLASPAVQGKAKQAVEKAVETA